MAPSTIAVRGNVLVGGRGNCLLDLVSGYCWLESKDVMLAQGALGPRLRSTNFSAVPDLTTQSR